MKQDPREVLCEMGYEDSVVFDNPDYDDAIIGVTDEGRVVYDYDAMVRILVERDGMDETEAIEFIEYNTIRAIPYAGEYPPIIITKLELEN